MNYNFDTNTIKTLSLSLMSVVVVDHKGKRFNSSMLLHEFLENNEDSFSATDLLYMMQDLLQKGRHKFAVAMGDDMELFVEGIMPQDAPEFSWDPHPAVDLADLRTIYETYDFAACI